MNKGIGIWLGLAVLGVASTASAHIDINGGGTHQSRDDGQKDSPCGTAGSQHDPNTPYRYRPGATINISLIEQVPHPSYFRIAFDDDGDDDFPIPEGTEGEFGNCAGDPKCGAGMGDYCSNETVLLDHLDVHPAGTLGTKYTWSVTLPNIECDNCTLQIIQMMNDFNFHPAAFPADDIYYRCIDIVLSNDAPEVNETPVQNDGMVCPRMDPGPAGDGDGDGSTPADGGMPGDGDGSMTGDGDGSMSGDGDGSMSGDGDGSMSGDGDGMQPSPNSSPMGPAGPGSVGQPMGGMLAPAPSAPTSDQQPVVAGQAAPVANDDDGGCRVASGSRPGLFAYVLAALVLLRRRRRGCHSPPNA